jgi:hypothetical protein
MMSILVAILDLDKDKFQNRNENFGKLASIPKF